MTERKWMTSLSENLRKTSIINLAIPGSHNSMTYGINSYSKLSPDSYRQMRYINAIFPELMRRWAKNQSSSILTQLNLGIRYFDLRIAYYKCKFYYCHGFYAMEWSEPLIDLKGFLNENRKEVVILDFQHFYNLKNVHHQQFQNNLLKMFQNKIFGPSDGDLSTCTLLKCEKMGKQIIIIYRYNPTFVFKCFWSSNLWPTPWPNVTSCKKLQKYLDSSLLTRHPNQGYVSQCIITPTARYIALRCLSSLRSTAIKVKSSIHPWLEVQRPGIFNEYTKPTINIILCDYIDLNNGEFCEWVIALNDKMQKN